MPHVIPADAEKFSIYKTIESKVKVPVAYRTRQCDMLSVPESTSFTWRLSVKTAPEKPIFIIVGFQMAKDGDQTKNPSTFDHVNLRNAVGLRAKLYSYKMLDGSEDKKCKGVTKNVTKRSIQFDDYRECLFSRKEQHQK